MLRGLGRMPPIAEQVVESFMEVEGYSDWVLKVLRYYILHPEFPDITQDAIRIEWFWLLAEAFAPTDGKPLKECTPTKPVMKCTPMKPVMENASKEEISPIDLCPGFLTVYFWKFYSL